MTFIALCQAFGVRSLQFPPSRSWRLRCQVLGAEQGFEPDLIHRMLSTNPVSSCFLEGMPEAQLGHRQGQGTHAPSRGSPSVEEEGLQCARVFEHVRHPRGAPGASGVVKGMEAVRK